MPQQLNPANTSCLSQELRTLIATRNRPMLTALEMCIEQLERLDQKHEDVRATLYCARRAADMERDFQTWLRQT